MRIRIALVSLLASLLPVLLAAQDGAPPPQKKTAAKKRIVLVGGADSHGRGSHEFTAGTRLLARELKENHRDLEVVVHTGGWPKEKDAFAGADAIVLYMDGGGGHPVNNHLEQIGAAVEAGAGLACLHYAVEVPKGESGDRFLAWIGGYFETHWSVNPHWTAAFKSLPEHPITRGVKPFTINDEWYFNMRFRPEMEGVTPILTGIPPDEARERPDGPHSNNPYVRSRKGEPEHVAWAYESKAGARGFGFTGGHFHRNWADKDFRTLVLNAVLWIAKVEVPEGGARSRAYSEAEAETFLPAPRERRREESSFQDGAARAKARFASKAVTKRTPGHAVEIDAEITGARELYLVVTDGGNGFGCDWADWAEPRLVGPDIELRLTELTWKSASSDWGETRVGRNAGGDRLAIAGERVEYGIGTHANSVIAYDLPEGYTRFKARGGLDNGGTDQGCGDGASVEFLVFTEKPADRVAQPRASGGQEPEETLASLEIHPGLEATLFVSEPTILSPTNLDVDARGRVWVCEVVNYRGHDGKRPEGDRILILEDVDGDGRSDTSKVFYQGRDIDSAMGICVLGSRVIVSASPNVFVFHDDDGDDKPDRKEVLFSKTGQPQHDHSTHSFLFGPDGKLYWNFGNTGRHAHDAEGRLIVDLAGNEVVDDGKPYFGGMVFRCNPDGSELETLAHNFRNNYEVTIDSFGTLWQSDNDDDGNQGVRINYVMEFGNYGYRDERTGAGWSTERTGMHEEVPKRHWHLNDPGVVPNLLQTGAGSPCGIALYEGDLLPEVFRGQMVHCEPGHSVVRAYPVEVDGAGYRAAIVDIARGGDRWFRPADVCVAPDGALYVTDWYDPGVGGHAMGDLGRGRIYRIAPPGHESFVPRYDLSSARGAAAALRNPNLAVRHLAWTALHGMGAGAEDTLRELWEAEDPRLRARALWLLGKIPARGEHWVGRALADPDPDLRATAIRLARQLGLDMLALLERALEGETSPLVLREWSIALRPYEGDRAARLWAALAARHDGKDRWYLEALGIGAAEKWDECLAAWLERAGATRSTRAGRDIIWRSRAAASADLLADIITDPATPGEELARYLRAYDFLAPETRQAALVKVAFSSYEDTQRAAFAAGEALRRLDVAGMGKDARSRERLEEALAGLAGTRRYVELVGRYELANHYDDLVALAREEPDGQLAADAVAVLLERGQLERLAAGLDDADVERATRTARALVTARDQRTVALLERVACEDARAVEVRREAVRGLTQTRKGAEVVLELARRDALAEALKFSASLALHRAPWVEVRRGAEELFPLPPARDEQPLPPLAKLVEMRGDAERGKTLFADAATCATCHVVDGAGKEVGPDLSGIGVKLARDALYESILYPDAGISHGYAAHSIVLRNGEVLSGIVLSETPESLTVRGADAIERTFKKGELGVVQPLTTSLMPADLHKNLSAQDLADVVAYLETLRKTES